ncbi:PREDICTED: forkhead box protein O4-like [Thamnophis sirtalis]|uniref:Forkhead box protein O4-like n=1 Tax=Thamnophis sirtalis TaxID=35019 RepID=A0A6I9XIQ8_9SAUR|nr:PREDICTED: forkhead box protein O4-like [Thamnophis sirtalis]
MAEPAGSPQAAESSSSSSSLAALDPEFPPQSRPRSCTWPLPRPELVAVVESEPGEAAASPEEPGGGVGGEACGVASGPSGPGAAAAAGSRKGGAGSGGARRNAWGSQSYADLISQAILSAPDKRLTLAQIYEWMVRSVPFFRDKGDSNSSAGWKALFNVARVPLKNWQCQP